MKKLIKTSLAAFALLLSGAAFQSCGDEDGMDPTLRIYQQYEVLVNGDEKSAFANFRIGGANGDRIQLTNGSEINVNALTMWYSEPESATEPEFLYAAELEKNHGKAIFVFRRTDDRVLTNEISFDYILPVGIPAELEKVSNGTPFALNFPTQPRSGVTYKVMLTGGTSQERTYEGMLSPVDDRVVFTGVPNGTYIFTVDASVTVPTTVNDGEASGTITLIQRAQKRAVKVED